MSTYGLKMGQCEMLLGTAETAADAAVLELVSLTPDYIEWQDKQIATAFVSPFEQDVAVEDRLTALLQALLQQHTALAQPQLVYLILPESAADNDKQLNATLHSIMQRMPQLLMAPGCRVFPYGSAGALMALNAACQYLQQCSDADSKVWLIAVDSMAQQHLLARYAQQSSVTAVVLSEGAVALSVERGDEVLLCFHAADAMQSATQSEDTALRALFMQLAQHAQAPLARLYLPDCGDDNQSERWLQQYVHLHGAIDSSSHLVFPAYFTGELGACGGLYRLWHLLSRLQHGEFSAPVAQIEMSLRQYRAISMLMSAKPQNKQAS